MNKRNYGAKSIQWLKHNANSLLEIHQAEETNQRVQASRTSWSVSTITVSLPKNLLCYRQNRNVEQKLSFRCMGLKNHELNYFPLISTPVSGTCQQAV